MHLWARIISVSVPKIEGKKDGLNSIHHLKLGKTQEQDPRETKYNLR